MLRPVLTAVAVLVASSVGLAADAKPTPAELTDIKQLAEDIFGLPKRKQACERLGDYGLKAWSAIPNLTELLTDNKEKDAGVLVAAATALGKIGGAAVTKPLSGIAGKHAMGEVRAAALAEVVRIAPRAADTARLTKSALTDSVEAVRAVAAVALLKSPDGGRPPAEAVQVAKAVLATKPGDLPFGPGEYDPWQLWLAFQLLEVPAVTAELREEFESVFATQVLVAQIRRSGRGFEGLGLLLGISLEEQSRRSKEVEASYERRGKLIADEFLARAEKAGPDGRAILARGFLRARLEPQQPMPAAPEVRALVASLQGGTPFERATAAAALAAVEKKNEAIKSLEAALKDDSPLVAAVAKEALAQLAKK